MGRSGRTTAQAFWTIAARNEITLFRAQPRSGNSHLGSTVTAFPERLKLLVVKLAPCGPRPSSNPWTQQRTQPPKLPGTLLKRLEQLVNRPGINAGMFSLLKPVCATKDLRSSQLFLEIPKRLRMEGHHGASNGHGPKGSASEGSNEEEHQHPIPCSSQAQGLAAKKELCKPTFQDLRLQARRRPDQKCMQWRYSWFCLSLQIGAGTVVAYE